MVLLVATTTTTRIIPITITILREQQRVGAVASFVAVVVVGQEGGRGLPLLLLLLLVLLQLVIVVVVVGKEASLWDVAVVAVGMVAAVGIPSSPVVVVVDGPPLEAAAAALVGVAEKEIILPWDAAAGERKDEGAALVGEAKVEGVAEAAILGTMEIVITIKMMHLRSNHTLRDQRGWLPEKVKVVAGITSTLEAVVVGSWRDEAEGFVVVVDAVAVVGEDAAVSMVVVVAVLLQEVTFRISIIKIILHPCNLNHLEIAAATTTTT